MFFIRIVQLAWIFFYRISGTKVNFSKSIIFSHWWQFWQCSEVSILYIISLTNGPTRVLGATRTCNRDDLFSLNYLLKLSRLKSTFNMLSSRDLTPYGKITFVKNFALSQLLLPFSSSSKTTRFLFRGVQECSLHFYLVWKIWWDNAKKSDTRTGDGGSDYGQYLQFS